MQVDLSNGSIVVADVVAVGFCKLPFSALMWLGARKGIWPIKDLCLSSLKFLGTWKNKPRRELANPGSPGNSDGGDDHFYKHLISMATSNAVLASRQHKTSVDNIKETDRIM